VQRDTPLNPNESRICTQMRHKTLYHIIIIIISHQQLSPRIP